MSEWDGFERADGLRVAQELSGWVILPRDAWPVRFCPCCSASLTVANRAKLVADRLFPADG